MKSYLLNSLILLGLSGFLQASPCPPALAALSDLGEWEGTGLTLSVFEQWLQALPPSPTNERVARAATQALFGIRTSSASPEWSEWEIARAINEGLKERTPHDRLEPLETEPADPESRVGLGFEYSLFNHTVTIEQVVQESPAARHGLKLGDRIEQVDQWSVAEHGARLMAFHLALGQHDEGTPVKLAVRRGEALLTFEIQPSLFTPPQSVAAQTIQMEQHRVGILTLRSFHCSSVEIEVARALDRFQQEKVDGIILDLRGNPGGRVDVVKKIAGYFLGKNKLLIEEEPLAPRVQSVFHFTHSQARLKAPMAVLVDSASSSAAEVLAGALQYYKAAYLVGTRSYGKGSVQTPNSAEAKVFVGLPVRLYTTSALYFLPNGRTPQRAGLTPDFEVHQPFPTTAQFVVRENALPNALASPSFWNPGLPQDPLRNLLGSSLRPRMELPDGDFQKEVALTILAEWIELQQQPN